MPDRIASKVDADGMLVVPVEEIADAELTALFETKPEMRKLVGAPRYWSPTSTAIGRSLPKDGR